MEGNTTLLESNGVISISQILDLVLVPEEDFKKLDDDVISKYLEFLYDNISPNKDSEIYEI